MLPNFMNRTFNEPRKYFPPAGFTKAENPTNVRLIDYQHPPRRLSAARKAGIRYESSWSKFAHNLYGSSYRTFTSELFAYNDTSGQRCCKPDGVLIPPGEEWFAIFEVKVGHIQDSFWQLRHQYEPVLSAWNTLKSRRAVVLEVCRRYDPTILYPCKVKRLNILDLDDYFAMPQNPEEVGVLVWKDK